MRFLAVFFGGLAMVYAQDYPPAAGLPGATAIAANSSSFVAWATGVSVTRGHVNSSNPDFTAGGSSFASAGQPEFAIGFPDGNTVSLGDGGTAVLTFASPIVDGDGFDFAVFENGSATYLELAFVEVSSDGEHFFRFPSHSQTQTDTQLGTFASPLPQYLNNLAGKYEGSFGTPFDLSELPDDPLLDKQHITHVKLIDVVGSIDPAYAGFDSFGNAVNDSFPTPFTSGGFDLQAVGVIHQQALGIDDFSGQYFRVYPNPATHFICIESIEQFTASIFDSSGKLLIVSVDKQIDISTLSAGVYLIRIDSNHQQIIRFLKN
ncbi:T9SS type A sorting domain-containing protein [Flavobacterium sp.]|uniref:T9SS type A sorting domain-containing protein n=1 Tax=Flavobacterium sp. TaxID=239 RepID=UPI0039E23CB2